MSEIEQNSSRIILFQDENKTLVAKFEPPYEGDSIEALVNVRGLSVDKIIQYIESDDSTQIWDSVLYRAWQHGSQISDELKRQFTQDYFELSRQIGRKLVTPKSWQKLFETHNEIA